MQHLHRHPAGADRGALRLALALILAFMAAEVAAGIFANSLALISDAGHMLTDAGAIGLSLVALRVGARPAGAAMTFGLRRAEILSAQLNGAALLLLAGFIVYEAVARLVHPPVVDGALVLGTALAGIAIGLVTSRLLARAGRQNLSVEGSFQHVLTDLFAFAGTALAAIVILATGFDRADPLASLLVAGLMLRSAWGLLKASGRVLLEGAPSGMDPQDIGQAMAAQPGVVEVHDLHVWEVSSGFPSLSAHVLVGRETDCHASRHALAGMLEECFGIAHSTLQVEHAADGELLEIERT